MVTTYWYQVGLVSDDTQAKGRIHMKNIDIVLSLHFSIVYIVLAVLKKNVCVLQFYIA